MLQRVRINKVDGNTGTVRPGADGIVAILAPALLGTNDVPGKYGSQRSLTDEHGGGGLLSEVASLIMGETENEVVAVKTAASVASALTAVAHSGAGTSVVTASGTPIDDYLITFEVLAGGTIGVAGATYRFTLDGGVTWSGTRALGTANSLLLTTPQGLSTGVTLSFAAGTLLVGQKESLRATAARMNNADLTTALEALRLSTLTFEHVLVVGPGDATMAATLEAWRIAREAEGRYYTFSINSRARDIYTPETQAAFKTAMDTAFGSSASISGLIGYDLAEYVSPISGLTFARDTQIQIIGRAMRQPRGVDASQKDLGPVRAKIKDAKGNPKWHDEFTHPGPDDSRFSALRTFPGEGTLVYIANPNLFSPPGSDYVYLQHARVMNRACEVARQLLTQKLSQGVERTEGNTISPADAEEIDNLVTETIRAELKGQISDGGFILSRVDDLGGNGPVTLTGEVWIQALAYIKRFDVNAKFVRRPIAVAA